MSTQVQRRRGTNAQNSTFTGAQGEVVVDTSNYRTYIHDGSTAGGHAQASARDTQTGTFVYGAASGTDTITVTLSPTPPTIAAGFGLRLKIASNNTGAVTVNVNSQGADTVKKASGGSLVDLEADDFVAGAVVDLIHNGTYFIFGGIAGGTSVVTLIERQVISAGTSQVDFDSGLTTDYDRVKLVINGLKTPSSADILMRLSNDAGSSYAASGQYGYNAVGYNLDTGAAISQDQGASEDQFRLCEQHDSSGAAVGHMEINLSAPDTLGQYTRVDWVAVFRSSSGVDHMEEVTGRGVFKASFAYDAIRIIWSGANITGGVFTLYGYRNS